MRGPEAAPSATRLASAHTQVHVKLRIIKNAGSMNLMTNLNDKPLRLIPTETTYMVTEDTVADRIICNGAAPLPMSMCMPEV